MTRCDRLRRCAAAAAVPVGLFLSAFGLSLYYLANYVDTFGYAYRFSTSHLVPAAMLATGQGFINPVPERVPGLAEFINEQAPRYDPQTFPELDNVRPPSWFRKNHRYLLYTVAAVWSVFGVSWDAYRLLLALMYAVTALIVYRLFRFGVSRPVSAAGTALFMLSPVVFTILPSVRDFGKAPFILGSLVLMVYALHEGLGRSRYWTLAAALGAVIGIGYGFRSDVLVCIVPALAVLVIAARGIPAFRIRDRAAAAGLFALVFSVCAAPILLGASTGSGGALAHDIIMGLGTERDRDLGLEPASYERVYDFADGFTHAVGNSYGHRVLGIDEPIPYNSALSAHAQNGYLVDMVLTFPGDMIARAYASSCRILGNGLVRRPPDENGYPPNTFLDTVIAAWQPLAIHLERFKFIYAGLALGIMVWARAWLGWAAFLLFLYFTGYACLQFHVRHYFHLTLVSILFFAFVWEHVGAAFWRRGRYARWLPEGAKQGRTGRRVLTSLIAAFFLLAVPLYGARLIQRSNLNGLIARCEAVPKVPLDTRQKVGEGRTAFELTTPIASEKVVEGPQDWEVQAEYLVARFRASEDRRTFRIEYDAETPFNDFSHELIRLPVEVDGEERVDYFFPVYQSRFVTVAGRPNPYPDFDGRWGRSLFSGVSMPSAHGDEFLGLYRVKDLEPFRLLVNVQVPEDQSNFRYWQRIRLFSEPLR